MLNYEKLIAFNPTIYSEVTNRLGQKVLFVEHPTKGDECEVIAVFPDFEKAFYTDFFELGEIDELNGEYEVLLVDGELVHGYEVN
jgi:hypothetical protein